MMVLRAVVGFITALFLIPVGMGLTLVHTEKPGTVYMTGFFASLCVFEALFLVFHIMLWSLRVMTLLWLLLCGGVALWGWLKNRHSLKHEKRVPLDRMERLLLSVIATLVVVQMLNTLLNAYYGNWDDETYCGTAVVSYYTDTADRYAPQHIVEKSPFYDVQHCLAAWPIYCAMLSVITKVHPAIVFRTLLPLLEIPTVYYIAYLLLRAFFPQNRKKAELALIFYYVFVLAAAEKMYGVSSEWWQVVNIWTSKALAFSVMVPVLLYLLICIESSAEEKQRDQYWRSMFFACTACCVISTTLYVVVPVFLALWGIFYLGRTKRWKEIFRFAACGLPVTVCAVFVLTNRFADIVGYPLIPFY